MRGVEGVEVEAEGCEVMSVKDLGKTSGKGRLNVFCSLEGGFGADDDLLLSLLLSGDFPMVGDVSLFGETVGGDFLSELVLGFGARGRKEVAALLDCGR